LTAAARQVQDDREVSAPYGFATRVVALAYAQDRKPASLFDAFALRALGIAALLAVFSVAMNYNDILSSAAPSIEKAGPAVVASAEPGNEIYLPTTDAVAVVLDIAD
jgi:hypothetical protein